MAWSFPTWLYLATRSRKHGAEADVPAAARPEGPLVWLHATTSEARASATQLARHISRARPGLWVLLSEPGAEPSLNAAPSPGSAGGSNARTASKTPKIVPAAAPTGDNPATARAFLDHWHPDLTVFVASSSLASGTAPFLPATLIEACHAKGRPMVLCDGRFSPVLAQRWSLKRPLLRALLGRMAVLMVQDQASAAALSRLGIPAERIETPGAISETAEPLPCSEPERALVASALHARPVWLAMATPAAEELPVLAAHALALRHAHRMLLILVPEDHSHSATLADRLRADGWSVARRTQEGEPDDETQILIADDPTEPGLWYRLAPVTYMGGTLSGAGIAARSPLEPAALGSAILHGPRTAPFAADYARLGRGARRPAAGR